MFRVLIAGAGIVGASIAWRLAQAGCSVTVADAGVMGSEASSAGAGMLAPGGEFDRQTVWLELGLASAALYPAFVAELASESGTDIDYRVCGALSIAQDEPSRQRLEARARAQAGVGINCTLVPEGVWYPEDGYVDPLQILQALRRVFEQRKVLLHERAPIATIEPSEWDAVVVAAGAWSGSIAIAGLGPLPETFPVKGHLLGYALSPGSMPVMRRSGHTYILQRANGFTIAGSNEERVGFNRAIDPSICQRIQQSATQLWPVLEGLEPSARWIGFRPATEDGLPRIGNVPGTNVWLAYGHYRNGILLAPVTAERIASGVAMAGC